MAIECTNRKTPPNWSASRASYSGHGATKQRHLTVELDKPIVTYTMREKIQIRVEAVDRTFVAKATLDLSMRQIVNNLAERHLINLFNTQSGQPYIFMAHQNLDQGGQHPIPLDGPIGHYNVIDVEFTEEGHPSPRTNEYAEEYTIKQFLRYKKLHDILKFDISGSRNLLDFSTMLRQISNSYDYLLTMHSLLDDAYQNKGTLPPDFDIYKDSVMARSERLLINQISIASPGIVEAIGKINPLATLRDIIKDLLESRRQSKIDNVNLEKDRDFRNRLEEQNGELELLRKKHELIEKQHELEMKQWRFEMEMKEKAAELQSKKLRDHFEAQKALLDLKSQEIKIDNEIEEIQRNRQDKLENKLYEKGLNYIEVEERFTELLKTHEIMLKQAGISQHDSREVLCKTMIPAKALLAEIINAGTLVDVRLLGDASGVTNEYESIEIVDESMSKISTSFNASSTAALQEPAKSPNWSEVSLADSEHQKVEIRKRGE